MLNFIFGPLGSGKTYLSDTLIFKELSKGRRVTLIVPEQEAIDTENRIFERAIKEHITLEKLTVVSFRRLANLAFRRYGGIDYNNIGTAGRLLILYKIISELPKPLKVYKNPKDRTLIELMLSVCEELSRYCVTANKLQKASEQASGILADKLSDLAIIYGAYCSILASEHTDSSADVNRLAQIYKEHSPDADEIFFIDSFISYTVPELHVIEALIKNCDVTITLNRAPDDAKIGFKSASENKAELLNIAKKCGIVPNIINVDNGFNHSNSADRHLIYTKLFDFSYTSDLTFGSDNLKLVQCDDRFSQAEYIAVNILNLIRGGAKFKDIAVITRNAEKYVGVLDAVFEKYGIPLFLSRRDKLTCTPIYKAINNALGIISDGYRSSDILAYMKSGICGFSLREIDLIESYVSLWSINGKRWTDDEDWVMNPLGFTDRLTESSENNKKEINRLRKSVILPIRDLEENLKNTTVNKACRSIYEFMSKSGIIDYYEKSEDDSDITAYNEFCDLLDILADYGNDMVLSVSEFSSLLYLLAKNTDYGSIPSTLDRVTAGDASIIRCNGVKHVFLTDCENGSFPASATDDSFFSDSEKKFLKLNEIEISPCVDDKNDDEAFYFLRAACGGEKTLTATLCKKNGKPYESVGFQRLRLLFPANDIISYPTAKNLTDKIQTSDTLVETIRASKSSDIEQPLTKLAQELGIQLITSNIPISEPFVAISQEQAREIFDKVIKMSYSSFEAYVKCPFAYFCNYVLRLKERKYNYFMASDMGTHIHRILEKAIQNLFSDKKAENINTQEIEDAVDKATADVLSDMLGSDTSSEGKRFEALLSRLKRTLILITENTVNEFKCSSFRPQFYELEIGRSKNGIPALEIPVDNQTAIKINGVIDRVDIYKPDDEQNTYVRIVDYKTGSKEHSVKNIKYALDTQMLIYLFSIWKSGESEFINLLKESNVLSENESTSIVPAGVLYQIAKLPITKTNTPLSPQIAKQSLEEKLLRTGVLNDDVTILNAMENGLSGKFISAKYDKKGKITAPKSTLLNTQGFEDLLLEVEDAIKSVGEKMKNGNACANPLTAGDTDACKYCAMYPVCRSKNNSEGEE